MIIFTSGTTGEPKRRALPAALPDRPATPGRALGRGPQGRPRLVHRRAGLVEVDAQRLHRAVAPRRRGPDPRRAASTPPSASRSSSARASTSSARRRPSTGCSPSAPSCGRSRSLRRMVSAGEPLNPEVIRRLPRGDRDWRSATATGRPRPGAVTGMRPDEDDPARDGSMGRPLPGIETRVDRRRAPGAAGDRPHLLQPLPRRASRSRASGGRPATTSREDEDGYLWFEGRDDDIIITPATGSGPFEVESALVSHPAVAEAAAVAGARRGARLGGPGDRRAAPTASPPTQLAAELQEHVKRVTAPYKYPRIVEFADELPKTPSGKIRRARARGGVR